LVNTPPRPPTPPPQPAPRRGPGRGGAGALETEEQARNRLEMVVRAYAPCLACGVH
jgi:Ni,Fe-hydrogenase I large subunit